MSSKDILVSLLSKTELFKGLAVEDIDKLHKILIEKNVTIEMGPVDQTWGTREMYVRDPDGNSIRFAQELNC